ncbi:MAG: hypothetical protein AAFY88_24250, partial [Acidobacteriota bacterium]
MRFEKPFFSSLRRLLPAALAIAGLAGAAHADPVFVDCRDQSILIPEGEFVGRADEPTVTGSCEITTFECLNQTDFFWPRFPIGDNQPAFCYAIDACGGEARCDFTVSVAVDVEEDCELFDFRDELGGGTRDLTTAVLGDGGSGSVQLTDSGAEVLGFGSELGPSSDNGTFAYRAVPGAFRVETPLPSPEDAADDPKGGLTIRWGLGDRAARAMAVRRAAGNTLEFAVRRSANALGEPLATTIPAAGVTDLALEFTGATVRAEYSTDGGDSWIQPGGALGGETTVVTGGLGALAGFIVSSQSDEIIVGFDAGDADAVRGAAQKAAFEDASFIFPFLKVCALDDGPPPPAGCQAQDDFNDGVIDPAWTLVGVGNANQQSVVEEDGVLKLTADGATAFYGADNAGFLYRQVTGNFRMETTVDGAPMTTGGIYRKAGLMVRESLAGDELQVGLVRVLPEGHQLGDQAHVPLVEALA